MARTTGTRQSARGLQTFSELWESCVDTEILDEVFDRGTAEVREMKFRIVTEEDDTDFQAGNGACSTWERPAVSPPGRAPRRPTSPGSSGGTTLAEALPDSLCGSIMRH